MKKDNAVEACLFGMAIGDGFGAPTEFKTIDEILSLWPPSGPQEPVGNPIQVTDDTQMAIAVGKALMASEKEGFSPSSLVKNLTRYFIDWLNDPQNDRAPGMTCLRSCEKLERGLAWEQATDQNSKGCGANMRVVPVGLLAHKGVSEQKIGAISQLQSAISHAHPTALAASEITAITVSKLLKGTSHEVLLDELIAHAESQKNVYHEHYMKEIWDRPPFRSASEFMNLGWEEVIAVLNKVKIGVQHDDATIDPCLISGEGWIAEEAFATALLCFLLFPDEPIKVLQRAVVTSGDSDSIACLAGAFSGVYCGLGMIPSDWVAKIEYKNQLERIAIFYKNQ